MARRVIFEIIFMRKVITTNLPLHLFNLNTAIPPTRLPNIPQIPPMKTAIKNDIDRKNSDKPCGLKRAETKAGSPYISILGTMGMGITGDRAR